MQSTSANCPVEYSNAGNEKIVATRQWQVKMTWYMQRTNRRKKSLRCEMVSPKRIDRKTKLEDSQAFLIIISILCKNQPKMVQHMHPHCAFIFMVQCEYVL
jgi:hypothetical protein